MDELEIFYRTVEAEIRKKHVAYLKTVKVMKVELENSAAERGKKKRKKIPVEVRLLKGYNSGIETALDILKREFESYSKRLEKIIKEGQRF